MLLINAFCILISAQEYITTNKVIIGEVLVKTIFPGSGGLRLITYVMIFSVISWYCAIKIGGDKVSRIPKLYKSIFQVGALLIAVVTLYEFVYNLVVWNSLITIDISDKYYQLDQLVIAYPNPETPWNLVFSTKMTLSAFIVSAHAFYVISKNMK